MDQLEFHPYKGGGVPVDFEYEPKHQGLVDFFNNDALKCEKQIISKVFEIVCGDQLVGFIALSLKSIDKKSLSNRKSQGPFARPALVIGQLIFDKRYQSRGYGKRTIAWTILLVRLFKKFLPLRLLCVDAIDEEAAEYYRKRGFESLKDQPDTLVLDLLPILREGENV